LFLNSEEIDLEIYYSNDEEQNSAKFSNSFSSIFFPSVKIKLNPNTFVLGWVPPWKQTLRGKFERVMTAGGEGGCSQEMLAEE
jgi:hypothetical protein